MLTNKKNILAILVVATLFLSFSAVSTTKAHVEVGNHCDSPTTTLTITASPKGTDDDLSFDKDTLSVPKNTCFTMIFENKAPTQEHSFVIEATSNFDGVHIHLMNNTSGPNGDGKDQTNLMSPNSDVELTFICGVSGHRGAGMVGTLVVGSPKKADGFGLISSFFGLISGFFVVSVIRKQIRKQKLN